MELALARHDAILTETISLAGGEVFKHTGDGLFAVFADACTAVSAAVAGQQRLTTEEWGDVGPLKVRMALHTGDASARGGDYFGPTLNRTARVLGAIHGGQVVITAATRLAAGQLPEAIEIIDRGEHHLRGLAEPEHLFEARCDGLGCEFPPLRSRGGPVGTRESKDTLFDAFASITRALASGRRGEIVELLAQGERAVDEIAAAIGHDAASTARHLRVLAGAELLRSRREGDRVIYRLAGDDIEELWAAVRGVAARHVDAVERLLGDFLGERDPVSGLDPVSCDELADLMRRGDVLVIDVRPEVEYQAGHVAGARSVPLPELERRIGTLPQGASIVAYCRGPYCIMADEAVRLLHANGVAARRCAEGFPELRRAGLDADIDAVPRHAEPSTS
jgi:DNA-binding transcriptional ArsR family regulator